jgi:hypothetical protein
MSGLVVFSLVRIAVKVWGSRNESFDMLGWQRLTSKWYPITRCTGGLFKCRFIHTVPVQDMNWSFPTIITWNLLRQASVTWGAPFLSELCHRYVVLGFLSIH